VNHQLHCLALKLLIDFGVAVTTEAIYELKRVDNDFFESIASVSYQRPSRFTGERGQSLREQPSSIFVIPKGNLNPSKKVWDKLIGCGETRTKCDHKSIDRLIPTRKGERRMESSVKLSPQAEIDIKILPR
jgi:hypothetical protein